MGFLTAEDQREREEQSDVEAAGFPRTVEELETAEATSRYDGTIKGEIGGLQRAFIKDSNTKETIVAQNFANQDDLTPRLISRTLGNVMSRVSNSDRKAMVFYEWDIRAATDQGARVRTRAFTRFLHPTEFDEVKVKILSGSMTTRQVLTAITI